MADARWAGALALALLGCPSEPAETNKPSTSASAKKSSTKKKGTRLVYKAVAVMPDDLAESIEARLKKAKVKGATVQLAKDEVHIECPTPKVDEVKALIRRRGRLELRILDDAANFFEPLAGQKPLPKGMMFLVENAPVGPGKTIPAYYPKLDAIDGESIDAARGRFAAWVAKQSVPAARMVALGAVYTRDEKDEAYRQSGWRAYHLLQRVEIDNTHVKTAEARVDTDGPQWFVMLSFTDEGAKKFAAVTEAHVKHRFAIMLDGVVKSAPEIREKIAGGEARITMGAGGADQQERDANDLTAILNSGKVLPDLRLDREEPLG